MSRRNTHENKKLRRADREAKDARRVAASLVTLPIIPEEASDIQETAEAV